MLAKPRLGKNRERLIRIEHDIWLREKLLNGYEWNAETKDHLRLHRDVAPFNALPKSERAFDAAIVDSIPRALAEAGYTLERIPAPGSGASRKSGQRHRRRPLKAGPMARGRGA